MLRFSFRRATTLALSGIPISIGLRADRRLALPGFSPVRRGTGRLQVCPLALMWKSGVEAGVGGSRRIAVAERAAVVAERDCTADLGCFAGIGEGQLRGMATDAGLRAILERLTSEKSERPSSSRLAIDGLAALPASRPSPNRPGTSAIDPASSAGRTMPRTNELLPTKTGLHTDVIHDLVRSPVAASGTILIFCRPPAMHL